MNNNHLNLQNINVEISPEMYHTEEAERLVSRFANKFVSSELLADADNLTLKLDCDGLSLISGNLVLRGDYTQKLRRLTQNNLNSELLVRISKLRNSSAPFTAIDATAGLGEDSLLLAAAGFDVNLYERNPVIFELLCDTVRRAALHPELSEIVSRMHIFNEDSITVMNNTSQYPDIVLLDPMFPERQKSSLVKKKLQVIQELELPADDEVQLMLAAINARPQKLIIKRPPKGPYLAGIKPDHSLNGKAIRFDCIVSPYDRIHKFRQILLP